MYKISGRSENVQMCTITLCRRSVYDHLAAAGNEIINVIEQTQKTCLEEQTKVLIEERLVAAASEILDGFEIVIREYQQEIDRNRLLNVILKPFIKLHRAADLTTSESAAPQSPHNFTPPCPSEEDARSLHSVCQEERPPDQEVSEPPPIKDEQEEMLICPEGEQLPGLEDVDGKLNLNAVPVKSEDYEEDRLSLFDPTQHLDSRNVTTATEEIKTAHEEDCGATELEPSNEYLHPSYCSENEMKEVDIKLNLNAVPVKSEDYEEDRLSLFDPTQHLDSRNVTTSIEEIKTAHEEDCGATELEPSNKCLLPSSYCSENEMEEVDIKLNLNAVPVKSEDYEEDRLSLFDPTQHLDSRNVTTSIEEIKTAHEEDCGATELEPSNKCLLPSSYCSENEMEEVDIKLNLNAVPVKSEDHEEDCGATELEPSNDRLLPSSYCSENEMDVSEDHDDLNDSRPSESELSMQKQSGKDKPCSSTISKKLRSTEPSSPSSLDCKVCQKFCPNSMTLMRHVKIHSTECGLCGKHLKSGVNLKMHIEVHKQCIVCSKICSSISGLERHMKSHTGEKLFGCTLCEKRFIQSSSLKRHMTSHDNNRSFTCTSCNKAFKQSGSLKTHMRIHTGEKPFKCTECDNCFSTKASLNQHIRVHTGERPFSCTVCEKRFTQRVSLNLHRTTHTGEKPFKCTLCEKGFSQKVSLKTHMTTHTGEKPFKCTLCEKGFSQKVSLKMHMTTHTGEKPFKCTLCEKGFSQRVSLKGHMTTHS